MATNNREHWLTELSRAVAPVYAGFRLSEFRVTCGWPASGGLSTKRRRVGECHGAQSSKGGLFELFISPVLDDSLQVAGTVCHELAHVAAGVEAQHKGQFVRVCRAVGLTKGKPTSVMPGAELDEKLRRIIERLGAYPHQALQPVGKLVQSKPGPVILVCGDCGCKVQISLKWLEEAGPPSSCGCGGGFEL